MMSTDSANKCIENVVKDKIFPRTRFHGEAGGGLDCGGRICRVVMRQLGWDDKPEEWKKKRWSAGKMTVRKAFKSRKNSCHTAIKRATLGE